jgi:hypothetical protein
MKTFKITCAQGDVCFVRRDTLPKGIKEIMPVSGAVTITHSETGHDHVMVLDREGNGGAPAVRMFADTENPLIAWLEVNRPTALEHKRSFDTHEPIMFDKGIYEVRRQREYTPEGFRRVED